MLEQFKNSTLGGSYGNPKTGTYKGQCVSYARKYMEEVLGVPTYPAGDAKDYWNNKISTDHFDKKNDPQNGDIVVYGAVPGNKYGHIGIWYNGELLSQNYNVPLRVTLASPNLIGNRFGYLRKKGEEEDMSLMTSKIETTEDERQLFLAWVGRNPYPQEVGRYKGWLTVHAWNNIAQNQDRLNIDKMNSVYYKNNSQIPSAGNPSVVVNGLQYEPKD